MTDNLSRRGSEYKTGSSGSFTDKYHIHSLVHYEVYDKPTDAIHREKTSKPGNEHGNFDLSKNTILPGTISQKLY